ncbi:hypothetical protein [Anabaena sp. CCY 9910]|uniref:hypothetical protein n=1 Tax=Anabaena sp. CCY 9910 TaxID=3103870 RepID=UPI0039DFDD11
MSLENPSPLAIAPTLWNIGLVSEQNLLAWVAHNCCGSTETPEAVLGYHLEHLYCDCEDVDAAISLLRVELPKIMPRCKSFASIFLEQVPGLELCI